MNLNKIVELLSELEESSFFEGDSQEEIHLQWLIEGFLSNTRQHYTIVELATSKDPLFTEDEIMALKSLANMTLGKIGTVEHTSDEPKVTVKKSAIKGKRGRPVKKENQETIQKPSVNYQNNDEYIDSEYPLRDPQTGKQQVDPETGKPMFLRIKKNAGQVKPPGYIPINNAQLSQVLATKAQTEAAANSAGFEKKMTRMVESSTMTSNADQGLAAALKHALK